jgi:coenzyme F420-reducing hydrogenase beta subunit
MEFDNYGELKPTGDVEWYNRKSESFTRTCPFSPQVKNENILAAELFPSATQNDGYLGRFESAYVGHVSEEDFRIKGSSGGMVTWVATELLRKGLIEGVAHVVAVDDPQREGKYFQYRIARTETEIREGAKSRYYPIELSKILKLIRDVPGRYAVIGIPCFIKAIHLIRNEEPIFRERVRFTLGLFCGHMKSARFVESFAWQMKVPAKEINRVEFRHKDPDRPANLYNAMLTLKNGTIVNKDWWHLADGDWGAGFFMNNACNYCDDVVAETADISFGDAWVEPYSSDGRGTNVVIVRSKVVEDLIKNALGEERLSLESVNAEFVTQTQAAGFRQRREGLAYRLTWNKKGVKPCKRVVPDSVTLKKQRKIIYRIRYLITASSHTIFRLATRIKMPQVYILWARFTLSIYHGIAYHHGNMREMLKRFKGLNR